MQLSERVAIDITERHDHIRTSRVALRPVGPADLTFVYQLLCDPSAAPDGPTRGLTPPPAPDSLWRDVAVQFLVVDLGAGAPCGVVTCYDADFRNQHAKIRAVAVDQPTARHRVIEGIEPFCDYLFGSFPFRKLYGELAEPEMARFRSGSGRHFTTEGRLTGHEFRSGRFVDVFIVSIDRGDWVGRDRHASLVSALRDAVGV